MGEAMPVLFWAFGKIIAMARLAFEHHARRMGMTRGKDGGG